MKWPFGIRLNQLGTELTFMYIAVCTSVIYINLRPAGPLDFPPPAGGGGGAWTPSPHDLGSWSP